MEKLKGFFSSRRTTDNLLRSDQSRERSSNSTLPDPPRSRPETKHSRPSSESPVPVSSLDGVEVLYDCSEAMIDICFVHGLTGSRDSTWTAHGQSTPWPKTLLPLKLSEARILTYGYDAYIVQKSVASANRLIDHATNLLNDLTTNRACCNASSRPLIFVTHSLGGLVCKEAILLSRNNPDTHLQDIFDNIKGIIFMGTPHRGAWMAKWANIPASALGLVKSTNKSLLKILETDDQFLESIQARFWAMIRELRESGRHLEVTCFFEELSLPAVGKVVSKESATLEGYNLISIYANHRDMVKFDSAEDNGFTRLLGELTRWKKQVRAATSDDNPYEMDDKDCQCLEDLRVTDPRDDKTRIEKRKGDLLEDSYRWILENLDFRQWYDDQQSRLLWIKGDPGKGKTMLLCGIIDELKKSTAKIGLLSFFFFEGTDMRINNATAVLRGLVYLLVDQQPSLIQYLRKKYDHAGKALFKDVNAWVALSGIFADILQSPSLKSAYLIIDALDECQTEDLPQLLDFIVQMSSASSRVKWIVSSRNWRSIEERLETAGQKVSLCLELNAGSISTAVSTYIRHKVLRLAQIKKYSNKIRDDVGSYLSSNANDTFLWVALVCQNLEKIPHWDTPTRLNEFPAGLDPLYKRMVEQVCNSDYANLYKRILAIVTLVYRPITLKELASFVRVLESSSNDLEFLEETIGLYGSFLTVRERTVYFVHHSAKDFLLGEASDIIFPSGIQEVHHTIFSKSLQVMSITLQHDVYGLRAPGFPIDQVEQPDPDPLAAADYPCVYWVDHLCDWDSGKSTKRGNDLQDGGATDEFLRQKYLYWLEGLSLRRSISEGVLSIAKLENLLQGKAEASQLINLVRDAHRFIRYHKWVIEKTPLQVYISALVFSPAHCLMRELFKQEEPGWIAIKPAMQDDWSSCLQTLEGHSKPVNSVAFSHGDKQLVSASDDGTIKIWDTASGKCLQTLEGHSEPVRSVTFSHDDKQLASASDDGTIKIWDTTSGKYLLTLEGHSGPVNSVAFSHDDKQLASASSDRTIKIWDTASGKCLQTLEGHSGPVRSVAFSHDDKQLASASSDRTIKIWDTASGKCLQTLEGHSDWVNSVAFSHDDKQLASASDDRTIKIWDTASGKYLQTLEGHSNWVSSVTFSHDDKQLASASDDRTIKIWDTTSGKYLQTLEGHSEPVRSVAFSHGDKQLASASSDRTIKIWDTTSGKYLQTLEGHSDWVNSITFSHDDKQLASASDDRTIKIWDTTSGKYLLTLEGHSDWVNSVTFSHDDKQLASASDDRTIKIWDTTSGKCLQTLEGHSDWVNSVAFSHNDKQLASASHDRTIKIWDTTSGKYLQTLEGHSDWVRSVAFSHDDKQLASASDDRTIKIWDTASGKCLQTLDVSAALDNISFGTAGQYLRTDIGAIVLDVLSASSTAPSRSACQAPRHQGYGISSDRTWVTYDSENLLWLPSEYRPICSAMMGSTVAIGCVSGRVLIFNFMAHNPLASSS